MRLARTAGLALLAVLAAMMFGCAPKAEQAAPPPGAAAAPGEPSAPPSAPAAAEAKSQARSGDAAEAPRTIPRKIIYEGYVTLESDKVGDVLSQVAAVARRLGGYEGNMEQSAGDRQTASIVLRVPAEKFGALMTEIAKLGRVMSRRVEAKDVGEEWVDLEARIKTKRQEEERLLQLLDKAGGVSALLEVERELSRVRGEIEQAQGRLRFLGNQVDLSTVHVEVRSPAGVAPAATWRATTVIKSACQDFLVIGHAVLSLVIYVLVMLPYWLAFAGLVWWTRRRRRGSREPGL
ncbi:MAG: DUF4349 domain-containing protein [Armatimonadetes bacterium]|nr:DUF4349 domain-containing protein [Armatimonadota bacterium]